MDTMLGLTVWDTNQVQSCTNSDMSVLFEGAAKFVHVKNRPSQSSTTYLVVEQFDHVFALQLLEKVGLCLQEVFNTEHPKLVVVERLKYGFKFSAHSPKITENSNLLSYINSKFMYIEISYKKTFDHLYKEIVHRRCLQHREILKNRLTLAPLRPNAVTLLLQNKRGFIGRTLGEILLISKCTPRKAEVRRTKRCYKQLPVAVDNQSYFMSPVTHILQRHAEEISCNELSTPMFYINDKWIGFNPSPEYNFLPIILQPDQKINLNFTPINLGKSGLYTYEEIKGLQDVLMFGIERESILNVLVRKVSNLSTDNQGIYSTFLFDEAELKTLAKSTLSYLWEKLLEFGTVFSALYGIYFIFRLLKYLLSIGLHVFTLYKTFGLNWKLLASFWSSLSLLIMQHDNLKGRGKGTNNESKNESDMKDDNTAVLNSRLLVNSPIMHEAILREQGNWV